MARPVDKRKGVVEEEAVSASSLNSSYSPSGWVLSFPDLADLADVADFATK